MATNPRSWKSLKAVQSKFPHLKEWVLGITDEKKHILNGNVAFF